MSVDGWMVKETVAHVKWNLTHKEEKGNPNIWDNMDQPEGHYTYWSKPDTGKKKVWSHSTWNLKMFNS